MKTWLRTSEASLLLGISNSQLRKLRRIGVFKNKIHYRKMKPKSQRPTYLWNVDRCGNVLGSEPKMTANKSADIS